VPADLRAQIDAIHRIEFPGLVARVARLTRDVALAEDAAQDALVAALETWPSSGVPDNPGAWLMATAKRRALDGMRHRTLADRKQADVARERDVARVDDPAEAYDGELEDSLLRLIFTVCHPVVAPEARVALALRLLGGLTTDEIARAFLVPEPTIAQRIVRAKRTLAAERIAFEAPAGAERAERLASVLEVIYFVFNEGYAATAGADWMRPQLCEDALRLGRVLAALVPDAADAYALLALMELQASRLRARMGTDGEPVLLLDQDRTRWDRVLIGRGLAALDRAVALGGARSAYALQAAIAACHARAAVASDTEWARIASLYAELAAIAPSPVVDLNRAVALSMAEGPAAALPLVDALVAEGRLEEYHLLPSVRGALLAKLGRHAEARSEFERAAALAGNDRERRLLLGRAEDSARQT
jgi:RNA polymerase sigma factor (sigma-70 family)